MSALDISFGARACDGPAGGITGWSWVAIENRNDKIKGAGQGALMGGPSVDVAAISAAIFALQWLSKLPRNKDRARTAELYGPAHLVVLLRSRGITDAFAVLDAKQRALLDTAGQDSVV